MHTAIISPRAARHRCSGELPDELPDRHGGGPLANTLANELQDIVAQRISALPSRQREVLLLTTYENMRPRKVAEVLGISESNVHANLSYAWPTSARSSRLT